MMNFFFLYLSAIKIFFLDEKMNIELISTFQQNFPEEFDGTLDCASMAVCCAFNKAGKYKTNFSF
jgi:hypothetical protein